MSNEPVTLAYTIPTACKVAAVSRSELYRAMKARDLEARKRGKRTLILAAELHRWVQSLPTADQAKAA